MISIDELMKNNIDPIPKYLILRDIIKLEKDNPILQNTKKEVLLSKWVLDIVNHQWNDGSFGQFHSLSQYSSSPITTEQALRRLLILGLDKEDEPIQKVLHYMERYLLGEIDLRDYKEKKHDWSLLTRLFVSTWILKIDKTNSHALKIAENWAKIVSYAFINGDFDEKSYKEAYYEVHQSDRKKYMWGLKNFYVVSILSGILSEVISSRFINYIIKSNNGIYYVYDRCLNHYPKEFKSKLTSRFIHAYEVLSDYPSVKKEFKGFVKWIKAQVLSDGFWDMGQNVKDKVQFPLSRSWRKPLYRKIDCTVRIQRILYKILK